MDLLEAIKRRRSIRRFKPDPIPDEQINALLESARLAPSGTNSQPWRFIVVKNPETRHKLEQAAHNQKHVGQPPVIIVCCADINAFYESPKRIDELVDCGALPENTRSIFVPSLKKKLDTTPRVNLSIAAAGNTAVAITHMMLQAASMELGTCWVRWFDEAKVKEILQIPEYVEVMAILPIGVPDENPDQRPRKPIKEIAFKEKYGIPFCRGEEPFTPTS